MDSDCAGVDNNFSNPVCTMAHVKYDKIPEISKEEVTGILDFPVMVQEKIDGANASIWRESNMFRFGSRNNEVESFHGLETWARNHKGVRQLLEDNPRFRLFGEWLVRHTVEYREASYNNFYLFDILDHTTEDWLPPAEVIRLADAYEIPRPTIFIENDVVTKEQLKEIIGQSTLGEKGEGVVIKPLKMFVDRFGVRRYAKMVTQEFTEENSIKFGGNRRDSDQYYEQYVVNNWMTYGRVKKIVHKLESALDRPLDKSDSPRVGNTCYKDMLTEEIWSIQKKVQKVHFKTLSKLAHKKAIAIFHEILDHGEEGEV